MKLNYLLFVLVLLSLGACKSNPTPAENVDFYPGFASLCATEASDKSWYSEDKKAPLLPGLEGMHFKITTQNEEAQRYFDQGLMLAYGFNHAEAARSFFEAIRQDTTCAMCYWGFAYVLGPNYNAGMEPDNYERAYVAIQNAIKYSNKVTSKEQALIKAMAARYPAQAVDDRSAYDQAYAAALKNVYAQYPDDPDIATLYAESLMDLHPWDLWEAASGKPKSWTPEILQAIEKVIALAPKHPGGHHLYIHATEASQTPEMGLASADALRDMVPGAGHLVHMPSHTYIRTGDYHKGTIANIKAVAVDSNYLEACHAQGAYPLALHPHNWHFLTATATFEGNGELAMAAAKEVANRSSRKVMLEPGWGTLQHYYTTPYYVAVKFGKWDEILQMRNFDPNLKYPDAVRRYARGMAYLGKNNLPQAKQELEQLKVYAADESFKEITIWDINTTYNLLQIAKNVLEGEILAKEGKYQESITLLKSAIEIEDQLAYQEPPDWFFSVRHHLGAILLEAGQYAEAEKIYREDLKVLKKNGWALRGLATALEKQGKKQEAAEVQKQFKEAWAYADTKIASSRII